MLLSLNKWGGIMPKVKDPMLLPPNRSQVAKNCLFDQGGIVPLNTDAQAFTPVKAGVQSVFAYYESGSRYFFSWADDADATKAPLPNDAYGRVFYTEGGKLKVTDKFLFNQGGSDYPMSFLYPAPPAPSSAPIALPVVLNEITGLMIINAACVEGDGTHALVFTGGGTAAAGTYTILSNLITAVSLTNPGFGYTLAPTVATQSGNGSIRASVMDPTLIETRGYVYTLVNGYGEEGPPSFVSNLVDVYDGNRVSLSGIDATVAYGLPVDFTAPGKVVGTGKTDIAFQNPHPSFPPSPPSFTWPTNMNVGDLITVNLGFGPETRAIQSIPDPQPEPGYYHLTVSPGYSTATTFVGGSSQALLGSSDFTGYNLKTKRIYRLNQGSAGAQYQFVAEIPMVQTTYNDDILGAALGEILPSLLWDNPPVGLQGIIALPNGVLAGFVGNLLCLTPPNIPHAWPTAYQKAVDRPIVGLSAFGTSILVLTQGQPYVVVGNDPSNMVMEKVEMGYSCMSKRGIVDAGEIVCYPCPEGLVAIGPSVRDLITKDVFSKSQWNDRYFPASLSSFYWEGKYIGFYTDGALVKAGFYFDFITKDFVDLDFYATAGFHDKTDGTLYLQVGANIVAFNSGDALRSAEYRTRVERFPRGTLRRGRVFSNTYPVKLDVVFPKIPSTVVLSIESDEPFSMDDVGLVDTCEVRVYGSAEVTAIFLASTMEELP